ncbi:MAG: UDP-N-acetylmuramate dehydrogenase [Cytophagales bacterium]|uniref:UDP-N-acetylenolpyruvoylglucosamine reductase n=1 Tax=Algoriphagus taiwanensis TaxID=1445656 RepID=A0ABQ6PZQ4_9BACT|nr:MAG: UDP-N-acetylmuramate dehydrogenase [Cytophagales bacterium]GMQ32805.1 UDP-N-acetylmuramate dehydrogenase [Algoriphagus taiwanensis]
MKIIENHSLKAFNTFGIDKKSRFFTQAGDLDSLKKSLLWAREKGLQVLILGGGSNVLLTQDFPGLVIKIELKGIQVIQETSDEIWVEVGAGENWHDWVLYALKHNWAGIENLSLIPGTVGASPMQNIGAYGVEIKEVFESLNALDRESLDIVSFDSEACQFGYRESIFKHELKDRYVITSVVFRLQKEPKINVEYGAIQETLKKNGVKDLTIQAVSDAVVEIRRSKLPDPREIGNAGSFFKNPTISHEQFKSLKTDFPSIPGYPVDSGVKVPAGWLIEQAGWKGKKFGEVGVHAKQALVLVNYGNGDGKAIQELAQKIQDSVLEKFGIQLSPEVNFI